MELTVSHEAGYVLACTAGPIDDSAGDLFREYLHPLIGQRGTKLVLDLSKSNFITSSGLGQLMSLVVHANTNSSQVVLAAPTPFLSVVFDRSKVNLFFTVAGTVAEAIEALKIR
jgi:anti-sigma B factor antagonist